MKKIVLVCDVYVKDGWYGERYRMVLQPKENEYFSTKTEASKLKSKLKKYTKNRFHSDSINVYASDMDELIDYKYMGAGPSLFYTRMNVLVESI